MNITLMPREYVLGERTTFGVAHIGGVPSPYPLCLYTNADVEEVPHEDIYLCGVPRYYIDCIAREQTNDITGETIHIFEAVGELVRKTDDELLATDEGKEGFNKAQADKRKARYLNETDYLKEDVIEIIAQELKDKYPIIKQWLDKKNTIRAELPKGE